MNSLLLPVVHPAFQNLRKNGLFLHVVAALIILAHAILHLRQPGASPLYFICLMFIAADILVLVFAVRNVLQELPPVNLFFRFIEILFFAGIGIEMMLLGQWLNGSAHFVLCLGYSYLFYCERKLNREEYVAIYHSGISIPALPKAKFINWSAVSTIDASYSEITIHTSPEKKYSFILRQTLQFEELDQIHEFCRHYLGVKS